MFDQGYVPVVAPRPTILRNYQDGSHSIIMLPRYMGPNHHLPRYSDTIAPRSTFLLASAAREAVGKPATVAYAA
jgi:hypothetical protein